MHSELVGAIWLVYQTPPTVQMMHSTQQKPQGPRGWFPWRQLAALLECPTEGKFTGPCACAHTNMHTVIYTIKHIHTRTHAHFSVRQISITATYVYMCVFNLEVGAHRLLDKETEAQTGKITCPKPHS